MIVRILGLGLALSMVAGCGSETGLMFKVTNEDGSAADAEELLTYVGLDLEGSPSNFVDDIDDHEPVNVVGRNLADNPFTLLVRPGDLEDRALEDVRVMAIAVATRQGQIIAAARLTEPIHFSSGEVREYELNLVAGPLPRVDAETGCVRSGGYSIGSGVDRDCDGDIDQSEGGADCDDLNPKIGPSRAEICDNGIDDNCNGKADTADDQDDDNDGYIVCDPNEALRDCFENSGQPQLSARINPGATEICNGYDDDCSGACDEGFDADGDGISVCGSFITGQLCEADLGEPDCRDAADDPKAAAVNPLALEVCDGVDNDCDGTCDESMDDSNNWDADHDKFTVCGSRISEVDAGGLCSIGEIDCIDTDPETFPGALEACDGFDNNCNGILNEEVACFSRESLTCYAGAASCTEDGLGNLPAQGACSADERWPSQYCGSYDTCLQDAAVRYPATCAVNTVVVVDVQCQLSYTGTEEQPVVCPGAAVQLPHADDLNCSWQIHDASEGLDVSVGALCAAALTATELATAVQTHVIKLWQLDPDNVFKILVEPKLVADCPVSPLTCTQEGDIVWPAAQ